MSDRQWSAMMLGDGDCAGRFVDVIIDAAHDPASPHPFKCNVDIEKLEAVIRENTGHLPYVCVAATINMAGGQPISLETFRAVCELAHQHSVKWMLDATRIAENAYFIQQREPGHSALALAQIVHDLCAASDGRPLSLKKDPLASGVRTMERGALAEAGTRSPYDSAPRL
jgi:tyrosine phenol-lyase